LFRIAEEGFDHLRLYEKEIYIIIGIVKYGVGIQIQHTHPAKNGKNGEMAKVAGLCKVIFKKPELSTG